MGIFNRLFSRNKPEEKQAEANITTTRDLELFLESFNTESASGIPMSWMRAIRLSATFACVKVIGNGLAQVPFGVYYEDDRKKILDKNHNLYYILHDAPNKYQTSFTFLHTIGVHLALTGNAFIFISRTRRRIYGLYLLNPGSVSIKTDGWEPTYQVTKPDGSSGIYGQDEVWHITTTQWEHARGLDTVSIARDVLGLSAATENFGSGFFSAGGRPSAIIEVPNTLTPEKRKVFEQEWIEVMSGNQGGKTAFLQGTWNYKPIQSANDQNQFLETRNFQIEEVCRVFGVNPILIFHSDKTATYASAEQMFLSHIVHTLSPLYRNIEQSANLFLLSKEDRDKGYFTKFNSNALLRGAAKDRSEFYKNMRNIGGMTINEIRELEDMNPVEGGDEVYAPLNSNTSSETAGKVEEEIVNDEQ